MTAEAAVVSSFVLRKECPVCSSRDGSTLYRCGFLESPVREYLERFYGRSSGFDPAGLEGAEYLLEECAGCGLIYQKQIPGDALMARLYDEWIDTERDYIEWREAGNLSRLSRISGQLLAVIAFLEKPPWEMKVLDFGLGWGRWARMAAAYGCRVCGTELSQARSERAQERGIEVIDMEEVGRRRFDYIHTEQVFEHLPCPRGALERLTSALEPAGLIKISVPNGRDAKRRIAVGDWSAPKGSKNSLNLVSPLEHINCYDRDSLTALARECALEPVKIPLKLQLAFASNWRSLRSSLRWNVAWPLYQNVLSKGTHLHFRRLA